jgi:Zn-dependent peptidase ImmA (M78 family)/transcriptional regulator with XRE-family HTH domain
MAATSARISPAVLQWARMRARMTVSALADRANVNVDRVNQWERGDRRPTFRQARHLAGALHIPFGYLFLSEPPTEQLQLPDFRRVHGMAGEPSAELIDTINDVLVKQQWYQEYARGQGQQPLPFVGKFGLDGEIEKIAADISRTIRLPRVRQESASWVEFLSNFTHAVEDAGILVMKSGIVEGNVHRKLSVSEFRGFTVSDRWAPVIFINGVDTRAAQIFTLAHELAHVWLDQSGISNEQMDAAVLNSNGNLEVKCNAIAAEVLVPKNEVSWNRKADVDTNLRFLSRAFRVSSLVILRRGHDLGFVDQQEFLARYKNLLDAFIARDEEQSGGGDFYPTLYSRNSAVFTETILYALGHGRASYTEAAEMLHVRVPTLSKIMGDLESKAI